MNLCVNEERGKKPLAIRLVWWKKNKSDLHFLLHRIYYTCNDLFITIRLLVKSLFDDGHKTDKRHQATRIYLKAHQSEVLRKYMPNTTEKYGWNLWKQWSQFGKNSNWMPAKEMVCLLPLPSLITRLFPLPSPPPPPLSFVSTSCRVVEDN